MGYTTFFDGEFTIDPPLNEHEVKYLQLFNQTRRMKRGMGAYFVEGTGSFGQDHAPDVEDYNRPPDDQPGLWCQWTVSDDGTALMWDEGEKAYNMEDWLSYIIDNFLRPGAHADKPEVKKQYPVFEHFTFDHKVNGTVMAYGEDTGDIWGMRVKDNDVKVADSEITLTFDEGEEPVKVER